MSRGPLSLNSLRQPRGRRLPQPAQREVRREPHHLEKGGYELVVFAGAMGIEVLPYDCLVRRHFKSPARVGLGDQRVPVRQPLARTAALREEGVRRVSS